MLPNFFAMKNSRTHNVFVRNKSFMGFDTAGGAGRYLSEAAEGMLAAGNIGLARTLGLCSSYAVGFAVWTKSKGLPGL